MRGLLVTLKFIVTIDPLGLRSALIRPKTGLCQVMRRRFLWHCPWILSIIVAFGRSLIRRNLETEIFGMCR